MGVTWLLITFQLAIVLYVHKIEFSYGTLFKRSNFRFNIFFLLLILGLSNYFVDDPLLHYNEIFHNESLLQISRSRVDQLVFSKTLSTGEMGLIFLASVVLIPVIEELFFREYLLKLSCESFNADISVILTSILFALSHHNTSFIQFLSIVISGVVYGYLWVNTKKVIYPIIVHAIYNLIWFATNLAFPKIYFDLTEPREYGFTYWLIVVISSILLFLVSLKVKRIYDHLNPDSE